jgi:hypothetical protein
VVENWPEKYKAGKGHGQHHERIVMEVRSPQAGLPIDRDLIFVTTLHRVLVESHSAKPIMLKFLIDSQRVSGINGHYEAEYELANGAVIRLYCKQSNDDMMFRVTRERGQLNYSVKLARYVNEDLIAINIEDYEDLVTHWLND